MLYRVDKINNQNVINTNFIIMSDRYTQRYLYKQSQSFSHQQQLNELAQENLRLRQRVIKYEQINEYIEVLIHKNMELEDIIKKERAVVGDQLLNLEKTVREQERAQAFRIQEILKSKVLEGESKIKQVIDEYQSIVFDQIELIKGKEQHITKIQEQFSVNVKQIESRNKQLQQLNEQIYILRSQVSNLDGQNIKIKQQKKLIQRALQAAENESYKLRQYNKEIANKSSKRETQLIKKEKDLILQLQDQEGIIKRAQALISSLKFQNAQMREEGKNLAAKISIQEKQIVQLERNCQKLTNNHQQLLEEYRKVCMAKAELESMYDELQNAIERRQQQMADLQLSKQEQGNRARSTIKQNELDIQRLQGLLKGKTKEFDSTDQQLRNLRNDFEFLKKEKQTQEQQNRVMKNKNQILDHQAYQSNARNKKLEEQLIKQQKRNIQNELDLQRSRQQIKELQMEISSCHKQYNDRYREIITDYEVRIEKIMAQFSQQREMMNKNFQIDRDKIKSTFEFALKQHETLSQKKLDILENDIDEYKRNVSHCSRIQKSLPKTARFF